VKEICVKDVVKGLGMRNMNKTGTYVWDEVLQRTVKVSDDIPSLPGRVWFPRHGYKYFDKSCQRTFNSNTEKRNWLKANGLKETVTEESPKHRDNRCAEIINSDREKKGMKPKTIAELKGDA
jgi:hypothetical protein